MSEKAAVQSGAAIVDLMKENRQLRARIDELEIVESAIAALRVHNQATVRERDEARACVTELQSQLAELKRSTTRA